MSFSSYPLAMHRRLRARVMQVNTPHGAFTTPTFMPVGTRAGINCLTPGDCLATGTQIILGGNTYHMLCTPGLRWIREHHGMHRMMAWSGPMLTDSGGFQVFSINPSECQVTEDGCYFKQPHTGEAFFLDAQLSIQAQKTIGADIIMAFDQCTPLEATYAQTQQAMYRTHAWLKQSQQHHQAQPESDYGKQQALFGIIQGGIYRDLREQSTAAILAAEVDGIAIGGAVIGFDMLKTAEILDWIAPALPSQKLRYTMGVGLHPQDLITTVAKGIDLFDCVAPTRNARHGALYSGEIIKTADWVEFRSEFPHGRLNIKKAYYARDDGPIMSDCDCQTCQYYSRGHLHELIKRSAAAYSQLACVHNIRVLQKVCETMREQILQQVE